MTFRTFQDTVEGWLALACAATVFALSLADLPSHAGSPAVAPVATLTQGTPIAR